MATAPRGLRDGRPRDVYNRARWAAGRGVAGIASPWRGAADRQSMVSEQAAAGAGQLLERDDVLAEIDAALLDAREGRGSAAVVGGPAGIGKSCVLAASAVRARERGLRVLWARGSESEMAFPFGGALALLERPAAADDLLSGAAALARPVLEGRFLAGEGGPVASAVHGLFWLVVNLCAQAPLVLAVDDLHALDEPTLRFLLYLQRRIDELPVVLLAASRPPEAFARPLLSELALSERTRALTLAPLSDEAVAAIVRARLDAAADDSFCQACARLCAGNPFYLQEALRELARERTPATERGARRLAEIE